MAYFAGGIIFSKFQKKSVSSLLYVESSALLALFAIVLAAPGNTLRIVTETETWFPAFKELSVGEHAFISAQWLLSSFANEGKIFFALIWIAVLLSAASKSKPVIVTAALFSAVALLPLAGITPLADMGINYIDPAVRPEVFPSLAQATPMNILAMIWWFAATVFTLFLIQKHLGAKSAILFIVAILCEAMMFFSPTIYASGERVFYVTDWILVFIILNQVSKIPSEKRKLIFFSLALILTILNEVTQASELLAKLNGN